MAFLQKLGEFASSMASSLNDQAAMGENRSYSLDSNDPNDPDRTVDYGKLGKFTNQFDHTAERNYIERGDRLNQYPNQREFISQQPEMTVVVKKRMFSSLSENFRADLMDDQEKLFLKASKRLFQNKCKAISAYEKLTKVERIVQQQGIINEAFFPVITSGIETLDSLGAGEIIDAKTRATLEELKSISKFSSPSYFTEWNVLREEVTSPLGEGTGTFELTVVASAETSASVLFGSGGASLQIEDPYKLMLITKNDVEKAIRESANTFKNNGFFRFSQLELEKSTDDLKKKLNDLRLSRGATSIRFLVNADTLLFKKVRAIVDEEGRELSFSFNGGFLGFGSDVDIDDTSRQGLNGIKQGEEESLFTRVVSNIYILISQAQQTKTDTFQWNRDTNYVRKKMFLHFAGKAIIQPMDVIHIFFSSGTNIDARTANLVGQSFSSKGQLFQSIDQTVANLESSFDSIGNLFGSSKETYSLIEKNAIAGEDFPMWLWQLVKNDATDNKGGTHCFGGLVAGNGVSHTDTGGFYRLNVTCEDNTSYLSFGQINFNPSVDVYNAPLYDPLTPFDLQFDPGTGFLIGEQPDLLPENKKLLNSGNIKFKSGLSLGTTATENNLFIPDGENIKQTFRRNFNIPDGFVYRWKEGIQSLTVLTEPHPTGDFSTERSPSMTKQAFAGQDIMNVLSILITGQPYNFNTFLKAALQSGNFNRDNLANNNSYPSFLKGLLSDIIKDNATWGNFIPFKKLSINESGYQFLLSGEFDITRRSEMLSEALKKRAERLDQLSKFTGALAQNPQYFNVDSTGNVSGINSLNVTGNDSKIIANNLSSIQSISADLIQTNFEIQNQKQAFQQAIQNVNINQNDGAIRIYGDNVEFDPSVTNISSSDQSAKERAAIQLRKKVNYLTQRKLWKVKANEDQNLFIVDDSYDKNYDIMAFEKAISGQLQLFNSTYLNIDSQVKSVASLLGLEVFADTQGHIQVRPPQYNRMPSSVFFDMLEKKDLTGQQIFPDYLEGLFLNQVRGLTDKIEIIEDEIRIRAAALGYTTDSAASEALSGKFSLIMNANSKFTFISDSSTGMMGGNDFRKTIELSYPDLVEDKEKAASLKTLQGKLKGILTSTINFDVIQRINLLETDNISNLSVDQSKDVSNRVAELGARLQSKTGQPPPSLNDLFSNSNGTTTSFRSQLDIINLMNQISQLINERAGLIKLFANALKNLDQGFELERSKTSGRTALLPFINKQKQIPEIIEHMIEDEGEDDIGFGSASRYIIKNHQIISFTRSERSPEWTHIEVDGLFGEGLADPPGGLEVSGGNAISTAWAVDFDLWRQYGFRAGNPVQAPFLSDPTTQCAPYAVFLLNRARREIFQADCTIIGNEYMQPGEVVYIEDDDLLFYVETVKHSFAYNGSFTTTLSLKYGRNPGEYIPTILDVIGKGLYAKKNQADFFRINRHDNANGDVPLGVLVFDADATSFDVSDLVEGSYGEQNRKTLSNILLAISGNIGSNSDSGRKAILELRTYKNNKNNQQGSYSLQNGVESIKSWISNPSSRSIVGDGDLLPEPGNISTNQVSSGSISGRQIDLGDDSYKSSPSQTAWHTARNLLVNGGGGGEVPSTSEVGENQLFYQIIDVWITFSSIDTTNQLDSVGNASNSQYSIQQISAAQEAVNKKIQSFAQPK